MTKTKCPMTKLDKDCIELKCAWGIAGENGNYCMVFDISVELGNIKYKLEKAFPDKA